MIISGIVLASRPGRMDALRASVDRIPWADSHFSDSTGRLVATIEALDVDESMSRLKELKALPDAVMAEMAQFYDDEGSEATHAGEL
jgi:nitrate reductase NapD